MRVTTLLFVVGMCFTLQSEAQPRVTLAGELQSLYDVSLLPVLRSGTSVEQISTWDTTGGNNDGFQGTYSFVRRNADSSLVIFEAKGPGVLHRIWTPTPTTDTLDFYIDDDLRPAFSVCYTDLFSGKVFPFVAPLCGNAVGGYYCYFPILFQRSCRVVCRGKKLQFHQFQYRRFATGTKVKKFSKELNSDERKALNSINSAWKGIAPSQKHPRQLTLPANAMGGLFETGKGGRITGLEFRGDYYRYRLRVTWDNDPAPAIDCLLTDLLGFAQGQPAMRSVLIGADTSKGYCYIPMPFDRHVKMEFINEKIAADTASAPAVITIYYSDRPRDPSREAKLYVMLNNDTLDEETPYHIFLNTTGGGHYFGTILQAEGMRKGETPFFEGDDSTAVDGKMTIHGTGSEDYFNGGWYDIKGRWDTIRTLPLHGCLGYSRGQARTGGYRFYLNDKIPFDATIFHAIEHGRTARGEKVVYRSVAFWYKQ